MARAAVRAKQAQAAQAQAAVKPSRKQRKHASGGNPNQDLFFSRLRRKQKWVFAFLILTFLVAFVFLGVGSGNGGGLESLYNGIFGNGGDPVAQAKSEIKNNPTKGYQDLANAYVTKNDLLGAVTALHSYLNLNKKDSNVWGQLGQYEQKLGDSAATDYQQAVQAGQLQSPGTIFQPTGSLAGKLGSNPIDDYYAQKNQAVTQPLLQKAVTAYQGALSAFQKAAKYAKSNDARAGMVLLAAQAAQAGNNASAEFAALKRYIQLAPNSQNIKTIEQACTALGQQLGKKVGSACTASAKK